MGKRERFKKKSEKHYVYMGDFETTVYKGQTRTDVWASALVRIGDETDHVEIFNSIDATYDWLLENVKHNCKIYYHNLKFDGEFWVAYLLKRGDYKQAYTETDGMKVLAGTRFEHTIPQGKFQKEPDMEPGTFKYLISDMGAWYSVTIRRHDGVYMELRDSLKLIPCSIRKMGKDFNTKHRKSKMEYTGYREPGGIITDEEKEYIGNDVLVPKEVLEIMFSEGHDKLTIGACCYSEYKRMIGATPKGFSPFDNMFPRLEKWSLDITQYGDDNADAYIRRAYHGGWCYVKEDIQGKKIGHGCTADVNSLYPSCMSGESKNRYPIGHPHFFSDLVTWEKIKNDEKKYYYIRVRTRFYLKDGFLPFIQIKRNKLYPSTEMLKTSDVYDPKTGKHYKYMMRNGEKVPTTVEITFSKTDWELVQKHYDLKETQILDGCWFYTSTGIFDEYINKYRKIKETSTGSRRVIAKLFLNSLYGKTSSGTCSSFKHLVLGEDGSIHSETILECNKETGYIAVGAAITSYARAFTITAAQANYDVFCYSDTDSCHLHCRPEEVKGITIHPTSFLCWKIETEWDEAVFVRQKTYAEHIVKADGEPVKEPYWDVKCAGLPERCKNLLIMSMKGIDKYSEDDIMEMKLSERELDFVKQKRDIMDFKKGIRIPGKLLPIHIPGGVVLADVDFTMH